MRIKRVEIIGFKSFCDRAVLSIDQPITGVVGPNGCGKSNIVDAIRWCMGEQSAKHLRGKAMEDVIFAGSETRAGAPMAEVSLTFDDVGFSHEKLATAMQSDEAAAEAAMAQVDALAPEAVDPLEQEPSLAAVVAEVAGELAPAAALGVDEHGQPLASVADEVRAMLAAEATPLDFTRYTEVTITRRLYRDGTSQYFINKVPCRLRDITDFFLGTGVGTKAYSIIEQGRIGQIVSSRPADRRLIIEEAAGITKFKSKKKAAERKLEQTKQNLLRVSDIVDELDKRKGTLRRQAQKAERYRAYKAELRDLELWKASHRYLELTADASRVRGRLEEAGGELEGVRAEWSTKDAQVVAERTELAIEERRLAGLQEAIYELDNRLRLTESKIGFETREAEDLEQRSAAAAAEIERLEGERAAAAVQLAEQEASLAALAADVGDGEAEVGRREAEAAEARAEQASAQRRLDEARAALAAARTDVAKAEAQAESLARRQDEAQRRMTRVCDELDQAEARLREVKRDAERVGEALAAARQTRLDLGTQTEGFEARRELLSDQVQSGEAQVETLRTELHRRRSRLQSLIEIHDRYEGFARGTRAVMQRASDVVPGAGAIRGVVADVVLAPETLELAVEAALGDRLGGVLVADHAVGVAAVGYLKSHAAGRSTFVPVKPALDVPPGHEDSYVAIPFSEVSSDIVGDDEGGTDVVGDASEGLGEVSWQNLPPISVGGDGGGSGGGGIIVEDRTALTDAAVKIGGEGVLGRMVDLVGFADGFEEVGRSLLDEFVVVETLERAVGMHRAGLGMPIVTLDGDVVDARGVVSGGSRDASGAGVLAQKREIRELEEIVGSLEHELAESTARLVTAKTELRQVQKALEGLRGEAHQGDIAIMGHEKDSTRLRADHDRARERAGQLAGERHELDERLATMAKEQAAVAERHAAGALAADGFEKEQLGLIDGVTGGRERADQAVAAMTEARVRAAQLKEKRASLEAATLRLAATDRDLGLRIEKLGDNIAVDGARAESLRADAGALAEELVGVRERRAEQAGELDGGRRGYEERFTALSAGEIAVRDLRGQADRLSAEVGQLEVRAASTAQSLQLVLDGIMERYQLELVEVVPDFHQRAPSGAPQDERAHELRELIERMSGDINLTAIDEYGEVAKRHEFLTAQRADLESAVGQLERAIDKINKTSRRLFKETFAAVNATFKEVFPRLFRGGNAHLSLSMGKEGATKDGAPAEAPEMDVLEAGVEIFAQPPGKKNVTVDQLSGGEKALTAVALVFSIFLIKPSPFCILDEVDAPLDEANVDRYNEIVREMTDRSQFIVITHNKRTMESADGLYGVTMQEAGVSKLVSVNLSRLSERRTAAA